MNLSDITKDYVNKPYKLGCLKVSDGCDCFSMILDYLSRYGVKIPNQYKGITKETYKEFFEQNPDVIDIGIDFVAKHTVEVTPEKCFAGDIIVATIKNKEKPIKSFGIDAGNGNMLIVSKYGSGLVDKKHYNVHRVFRCLKQYH